jgi:hypothetical protein
MASGRFVHGTLWLVVWCIAQSDCSHIFLYQVALKTSFEMLREQLLFQMLKSADFGQQ